ncbi:hypothetical protein FRC12_020923 [Ceratobasidium sp. 428]|nr:hypothetical protein FRC12_020923 [Ceratobasidium sp. 428]
MNICNRDGCLDRTGCSGHYAHLEVGGHQDFDWSPVFSGQPELDEHSVHDDSLGRDGLPNPPSATHESRFDGGEHSGFEHKSFDGGNDFTGGTTPQNPARDEFIGNRGGAHDVHDRQPVEYDQVEEVELAETVLEERSVEESESLVRGAIEGSVEVASRKMAHIGVVWTYSVVLELPRVKPTLVISGSPGSTRERRTTRFWVSRVRGERYCTPLVDVLYKNPQDFDVVTP